MLLVIRQLVYSEIEGLGKERANSNATPLLRNEDLEEGSNEWMSTAKWFWRFRPLTSNVQMAQKSQKTSISESKYG